MRRRETLSVVLGSRGSRLAIAQAEEIRSGLKKLYPEFQFEIKKIKTSADIRNDVACKEIGRSDIFTKQIDEALLKGEIDLAVHSMKDVPCDLPEGLLIVAVTKRKNPRDVLIAKDGLNLMQLPTGARVGTSSLRRKAQLLRLRPDLEILEIRGNLDTRLKKLYQQESDAIIVAQAGLERLNLVGMKAEILGWDVMLSAVGQGCLSIEARADDAQMIEMASQLNDEDTCLAAQAERAFLKALGGGCRIPVACLGIVDNRQIKLEGRVFSLDGSKVVTGRVFGQKHKAIELGNQLAENLLSQGAGELLK